MDTDASERNFTVTTETNETTEIDSFLDGVLYGDFRDCFGEYPGANCPENVSMNTHNYPGKVSRPPEAICNII